MMGEKIFFSRSEAASLLSISLRTLDNLQARKEIHVRRVGRKVLIHRDELQRFARRDHATGNCRRAQHDTPPEGAPA
jgi:excisionase family DNA binding protein